jgi:hypothetical protein
VKNVKLSISPSGTGPVCKTLGEGATAREFELRLRGMCDLDGGKVRSANSYGSLGHRKLTMGIYSDGRIPDLITLCPWSTK